MRSYSLSGRDQVSIQLQPHAGADPRPLGKGASGGELSRVMLAIEVVIASTDPVPTFIFDEVDAGVGGASAIEIGKRLARLAESSQVIVVTHLAQVAAFASNHLRVVKDSDGAVTASSVQQLDGERARRGDGATAQRPGPTRKAGWRTPANCCRRLGRALSRVGAPQRCIRRREQPQSGDTM